MDYRSQVAAARRRRDRAIERATAEARQAIAQAAHERDVEIRRLASEGLTCEQIAPIVGCSRGTVFELIRPGRRDRYNARRRDHWHLRAVA